MNRPQWVSPPGGRMRQEIYEDPFSIHDWDTAKATRCFIHTVNSTTWKAITGEAPPTHPPTAKDYSEDDFPWFDYHDNEATALKGADALANLQSVHTLSSQKGKTALPENATAPVTTLVNLRAGLAKHQVRESNVLN